ncbi:MAG: TonB-dependent receptor [Chthoniobacterales bacterium]|nr:TonB-dependent receptor [Chthoniobacterales bacterium]
MTRSSFAFALVLLAACLLFDGSRTTAHAQEAMATTMAVVVVGEAESDSIVQDPFLPAVQGTRINSGKKTSVIDLDEFPPIINNNYRQALARTTGLYLSEETTPLLSIGYRGLDPHRVQYTQVLKDGIPIHADQFGYPEAYYTPSLDTVDRIEFLRGGAALVSGPQPGGSLNFITHVPRTDRPFSFGTRNTFGSDQYFSNFTYVDGTVGQLGYYGYYNHRSGEGFRESNSAVEVDSAQIKLVLGASTTSRWTLTLEGYEEQHGEPGGLTLATGPNAVNYHTNRDATSRFFDHFALERYAASLAWETDFSDATQLTMTAWGTYLSRFSVRQRGGGFGTLPVGAAANSTTIEHQQFYTVGFEGRLRHDYDWLGGNHTIAGGVQVYHTDSPRKDSRGLTASARSGVLRNESDRSVFYAPVFVENRFKWGALSITPGVRLENIWQSVDERLNLDKSAAGTPLASSEVHDFVPLFGLGAAYEVANKTELYTNISQSYRPKIFTQTVPTGGTAIVPSDLQEGSAWQLDLGFRGNPRPWVSWDVSGFLLEFDDQIGTVALPGGLSTVANVGRALHRGVEASGEVDVIGWIQAAQRGSLTVSDGKEAAQPVVPSLTQRIGSLSLYGNVTLLHAEFTSGPLEGRTPRYAPDYLLRTGVIYRLGERLKVALFGTFVGSSYADDANNADRFIPSYMTWDLTAEAKVFKDYVSVTAGINNLFDEDYYARITNTGIDPAYGRNYYGGISLKF